MPHPDDRDAFSRLVAGAGAPSVLVLDGPVSLVGDGDPFALAAEEFVVIALPGREGAAEAYAAVKEIATALPHAAIRIAVNRSTSQGEAGEIFHLIADVAERHLGRVVRSYGGLPSLSAAEMVAIKGGRGGRALLFQRIARSLARPAERPADPSYFEEVWGRLSAARG
jgi:MinD-like ATPase involved in chromosome partitioning or flagellar assembly